jgi:hypothetical protein
MKIIIEYIIVIGLIVLTCFFVSKLINAITTAQELAQYIPYN